MQKDFPGWHRQKEQLHAQHQTPTFQEREIWWCSVGMNIGHEMDGKNQFYNRPVLDGSSTANRGLRTTAQ